MKRYDPRRRPDDPRVRRDPLYLAEGTPLLPADRVARARVHAWMFFEQNQIEATIASARFLAAAGRAWLERVEGTEGFVNDLAPFPAHVTARPI
jgi:glutathione S-transferase